MERVKYLEDIILYKRPDKLGGGTSTAKPKSSAGKPASDIDQLSDDFAMQIDMVSSHPNSKSSNVNSGGNIKPATGVSAV